MVRDRAGKTSLNLGIDRMFHQRMDSQGRAEKPNEINADEY
jgi:hypothetical protein